MGIPILILGASGSGKSTSLRNFDPKEIGIFNVASKPLPFRKKLPRVDNANYSTIYKGLTDPKLKKYVIDDSQYLMAFESFDHAKETGYGKFTDMALNFRNLIHHINDMEDDEKIIYFLHHSECGDDGREKVKTVGKMLDDKLTVEGCFDVVLYCKDQKFYSQGDGISTAKSPEGMFDAIELPNDLKAVDQTIREYYEIGKEES